MKRTLIVLLAVMLMGPASSYAQEHSTIRAAVVKAAAHAAAQVPAVTRPERNRYLWPGLVTIAGGATLAALAASAAKKETCGVVSVGFDVIAGCVQETNKPLLWTGIAAAAGGATLLAVGNRHHQISVSASTVRYRLSF